MRYIIVDESNHNTNKFITFIGFNIYKLYQKMNWKCLWTYVVSIRDSVA
jgi:hypothetical protein